MTQWFKPILAEFIGTFVLVFIGAASGAVTVENGFSVIVPALAHGFVVIGLIHTYGHISGMHINPAVTVALWVGGHIDIVKAAVYIVVQFLGGIVAAFALVVLVPFEAGNFGQTVGSLTTTHLTSAVILEVILTFFLVSAIYQNAVFGKGGNFAAIAIGMTLITCILAGGPYSGASLNPARTLGPAMAAGNMGYVLPYFVGIFAGGILAALVQTYLLQPEA